MTDYLNEFTHESDYTSSDNTDGDFSYNSSDDFSYASSSSDGWGPFDEGTEEDWQDILNLYRDAYLKQYVETKDIDFWVAGFNTYWSRLDGGLENLDELNCSRAQAIIKCMIFEALIRFALNDDGVTLFNLPKILPLDHPNVLYHRNVYICNHRLPAYLNSVIYQTLNGKNILGKIFPKISHHSIWNKFLSACKRYQKEWFKYLFMTYFIPYAQLTKQKRIPKELIRKVVSYL